MKPAYLFFTLCCLGSLGLAPPGHAQNGEAVVHDLGAITVTATRTEKRLADTPVATELISAEEIENSSAATVSDVLEDYGLMYSSNAMGDYIQLQGMGESRVLYLVDGKRIVGRTAQRLVGSTLPLGNIERIEIVRGPQSALYGSDGIGGVINIITKKPGGEFSLDAALNNRSLLAYDDPATEQKAHPFSEGASPFREQQALVRMGVPIGAVRNSLFLEGARGGFYYGEGKRVSILPQYWQGQAAVDSAFDPSDRLSCRVGASAMLLQSDQQITPSGSLSRSDYLRAEGSAELAFLPNPETDLTFRVYDHYYQRDRSAYYTLEDAWKNTGQFENENLLSLEAFGGWYGRENWIFSGGLEVSYNTMKKFNFTRQVNALDREALFAQAEYYRGEQYSLLGGFRVERNSQFGFAAAPKLSGMYRFTKAFRVLGSAGVGYRAPAFNDLYLVKDDPPHPLVLGNPDLRPEYALSGSLCAEYALDNWFASANAYYTELFDEIYQINTGRVERGMMVYETGNIARSLRTGLDTEGKFTFFNKRAFLSGGYSYVFAWDRNAGTELRPQPAHTFRFKAGLDTAKAPVPKDGTAKKVTVNVWAGGRFFSPLYPGEAGYTSRLVLDAFAALSFSHCKVYLAVDNLLGTIDQFLGPAVPQCFTLGIKYTY